MWNLHGKITADETEVMEFFGLKYPPMVKALDDTDLYKFSMGQTYHHQYGTAQTVWDSRSRNVGEGKDLPEKYTAEDREEIRNQLKAYCALVWEEDALPWLSKRCIWFKPDYLNFLERWRPKYEDFELYDDPVSGLRVTVGDEVRSFQEYNTYYEIPVLEIITETYYRNHFDYDKLLKEAKEEHEKKIEAMKSGKYHLGTWSEFGARRRLSFEFQDYVVRRFVEEKIPGFIGTSNVYLARKYNVTPVGTCAHEFIELVGQGDLTKNLAYSNLFAMESWVKEYGVLNGIWLTDTIGDELCRRDMQLTYSILFGGVRNDSGDPYKWADNWIDHYQGLFDASNKREFRVNPKNKTLLFSNNINNFEIWDGLTRYVEGRANPAFGIGTWLSGPQAIPALNNVMKLVMVNGHHVAKKSDDPGKTMTRSPEYNEFVNRTCGWRIASGE